jgi:3-phosphoshikimate 1-carboxyvinyltransferase
MGARVRVDGDDLCIGDFTTFPEGGCLVETRRDHRVAMSFALAGCRDRRGDGRSWLQVRDPACAGKTFPSFFEELEKLYRISHDTSDRQ